MNYLGRLIYRILYLWESDHHRISTVDIRVTHGVYEAVLLFHEDRSAEDRYPAGTAAHVRIRHDEIGPEFNLIDRMLLG